MKIALVDNMNNNYFSFGRYLRDMGHIPFLFTLPNAHFKPEDDSFDDPAGLMSITQLAFLPKVFNWRLNTDSYLYEMFKNFDLIFASGYISAFLRRAGLTVDVIFPYGGDLNDPVTSMRRFLSQCPAEQCLDFFYNYYQSMIECGFVLITDWERSIATCDYLAIPYESRFKFFPMIYPYKLGRFEATDFRNLTHIENPIIIPSRHMWTDTSSVPASEFQRLGGLKRTDIAIKGIASYFRNAPYSKRMLISFRKGKDAEEFIALSNRLGIGERVLFLNEIARKDVVRLLQYPGSICINSVRPETFDFGGVSGEALAYGCPLINYTPQDRDYIFRSNGVKIFSANDPNSVEQQLRSIDNIGEPQMDQLKSNYRKYFDAHLGRDLANSILSYAIQKKRSKKIWGKASKKEEENKVLKSALQHLISHP